MKLETDVEELYRSEDREMHDNQEVEEEIPRNKEDIIPADMPKSLEEGAMTELTRLCQDIYTTGEWPENFLQSVIITIKKKLNATACEDHLTISLLTHASKVMIRILTKRVQTKTEAIGGLGDDQFGFRKGMGTRDAIGILSEEYTEWSECIYLPCGL